jgi:hypothetical protein
MASTQVIIDNTNIVLYYILSMEALTVVDFWSSDRCSCGRCNLLNGVVSWMKIVTFQPVRVFLPEVDSVTTWVELLYFNYNL